jgi:hypothetical protein
VSACGGASHWWPTPPASAPAPATAPALPPAPPHPQAPLHPPQTRHSPRLPNLEALGDLNQAEVETLWDFQRRAGARSLKFRAWPLNVGFNTNTDACVTNDLPWRLTDAAPLNGTGIDGAAPLSGSGLWR